MPSGIFSKNTGYHNRQSVRLRGYDYSQPGYYFITICTRNRKRRLFGDNKNGKMILTELGMIAHTVGDIVGAYKSIVANECLKIYKSKNERMGKLWHRNYYDRIVRDRIALFTISNYIRNNPVRWHDDTEHHIDKEIDEWEMVEVKCDS